MLVSSSKNADAVGVVGLNGISERTGTALVKVFPPSVDLATTIASGSVPEPLNVRHAT